MFIEVGLAQGQIKIEGEVVTKNIIVAETSVIKEKNHHIVRMSVFVRTVKASQKRICQACQKSSKSLLKPLKNSKKQNKIKILVTLNRQRRLNAKIILKHKAIKSVQKFHLRIYSPKTKKEYSSIPNQTSIPSLLSRQRPLQTILLLIKTLKKTKQFRTSPTSQTRLARINRPTCQILSRMSLYQMWSIFPVMCSPSYNS